MALKMIFITFVLQAIVALMVMAFLKKRIDGELIDHALEQFEAMPSQGDSSVPNTIAVISYASLKPEQEARFKSIANRRFKGISLKFSTEAELRGGVKIIGPQAVIDCTLKDRLDRMFGARG